MHTVFNGVLFVNNANLSSKNRAPSGRVDNDYHETIRNKLNQVLEIAKEDKLRIIFTGNLFRSKFDISAISTFIDIFGDEKPMILASHKGKSFDVETESSLGLLSATKTAYISSKSGTAETFYIEGEMDTYELAISHQLSDEQLDISNSFVDNFSIADDKTLIVSADYQETEDPINGADGLLCCKWGSIAKSENGSYKFYAGDLGRDNPNVEKVSVTKWTEQNGFETVAINHDSTVFEDDIVNNNLQDSIHGNIVPCSEFAKKLKEAAENKASESKVNLLIDSVVSKLSISTESSQIIERIYKEVI